MKFRLKCGVFNMIYIARRGQRVFFSDGDHYPPHLVTKCDLIHNPCVDLPASGGWARIERRLCRGRGPQGICFCGSGRTRGMRRAPSEPWGSAFAPGGSGFYRSPHHYGDQSDGRQHFYFGRRGGALALVDGRVKKDRLGQQESVQMTRTCKNVPTRWRAGPPGSPSRS
jgi:hypothetical protein